jgi:hypothetical protein
MLCESVEDIVLVQAKGLRNYNEKGFCRNVMVHNKYPKTWVKRSKGISQVWLFKRRFFEIAGRT